MLSDLVIGSFVILHANWFQINMMASHRMIANCFAVDKSYLIA